MLVPKLRFGEFKDEWKFYKFYDVVKITNGQVNPNDNQYRNLPHIGPGNIEKRTGRLLKYNLAKNDNLISSKYLFDQNSVIYGKINPHFAKVCYPNFIGLCSADTYPINPNNSLLISQFLLYMLLTKKFTKFAISVSMRTGMPKINRNELGTYKFIIPPIVEQEKIANFLSLLDQKIEMQNKKIETLKIYKTGLIKQILNSSKNFKSKKLQTICKNLLSNITLSDIENDTGTYKIYGATGIIGNISNYMVDNTYISIIKDGAGVGKSFICESFSSFLSTLIGLIPQDCTVEYLKIILENINFSKYIVGSSIPHIYFKDFKNEIVKIIPYEEQLKISKIFNTINLKINLSEQKLKILQKMKKSLLQQMFI